ncbi:MAG: efflux transporter outer membrane subunit [Planctomycetota bacterium]
MRPPVVAIGLFALAACKLGPDYVEPELALPDAWQRTIVEELSDEEAALAIWWESLDDPVLDELIVRGTGQSLDLRAAYARVERAQALFGVATGQRVPDLDGTGSATRARSSEGTTPFLPPGLDRTDDVYSAGVTGDWEADVWGRVRRSIEASGAQLDASIEDYRDVLVLLRARIGSTYVEVRELQARIGFLKRNIESQSRTLQLTRDRYTTELAPELDVRQAELNLANTESQLPLLRQLLAQAMHRLGVLVGEGPDALVSLLEQASPIPSDAGPPGLGLPAELVRRRPDVRRAERLLAAATADVGVATAALYPEFRLRGSLGYESVSDLFDSSNVAWSFGPVLRWNLFDGGRVRGRIRAREAEVEEALAVYEQTVLLALEDVENALVSYLEERLRRDALDRSVAAAERSVDLVRELYRSGLSDFQNVLDTERFLFQQQDQLAASEGQVVQNLIELYRALGGGWRPEPMDRGTEVDQS